MKYIKIETMEGREPILVNVDDIGRVRHVRGSPGMLPSYTEIALLSGGEIHTPASVDTVERLLWNEAFCAVCSGAASRRCCESCIGVLKEMV